MSHKIILDPVGFAPEPPAQCETYLGDAVYASHDGTQIWLRTGDGNDQRIALDPYVYRALVKYAESLGFES